MEARFEIRHTIFVAAACFAVFFAGKSVDGANFRTQNFLIQAPDPALAKAVGEAAEHYRSELATYWLGGPLAPWPTPCPIRVVAGPNLAAQGVTTYNRAPVRDFQMEVVGTPERILDSVLPHEVTHTILATHFGRPLPRWADEGICTTVEHDAERQKHEVKLREFLGSRRGIAMNKLFLLTEYPSDVLPMYAQGYSVCRFLIDQDSPQTFIAFLTDYMKHPSWTANIRKHYGYESLAELQEYWLAWVAAGSGPVTQFAKRDPKVLPASATIASTPQQSRTQNAISPAPATALASTAEPQGWYLRQKNGTNRESITPSEVASGVGAVRQADGMASDRLMPPSVKANTIYSAAQPQPEQSFSRQGRSFRIAVPPIDSHSIYRGSWDESPRSILR